MKKLIFVAALGATCLTGAALAQSPAADTPSPARHMGMRGMDAGALMRADLNHDGVITRAEASAEADQRFAAMDTNHDGTVTGDERRAGMAARHAPRGDRMGDDAPSAPPAATDGKVPPAGDLGLAGPGKRGMGMRGGRDQTQAEFRDRALRLFDRVDTNGNGQVDRNEIEAARMLIRARMSGNDAPQPPSNDQ